MGTIYRKPGRTIWMIRYYKHGRPIWESSGSPDWNEARSLLRKREGDLERGLPIVEKPGRLKFDEGAADLINEYRNNDRASLDELERRIRLHLLPAFGGLRLSAITATEIRAFVAQRRRDTILVRQARRWQDADGWHETPEERKPVSSAEINRELATLKRIFTLAIQSGKLAHRPHIPMLEERNTRKGFFDAAQVSAVEAHLPAELRPIVRFAFITGWRLADEILPLQWRQVDFAAGEVRLDPETTKNREGRTFRMTTDLRALLEAQRDARDRLQDVGVVCPWVFHRSWKKVKGKPITTFIKAWKIACTAAGLPGRIPHDLRRSAVRTMVRAGVPERVAMQLTGHLTRSVFERYNVVSEGDLATAAERLNAAGSPATVGATVSALRSQRSRVSVSD